MVTRSFFVLLSALFVQISAAPMVNEPFQFRQPDGSMVPVIVNGDEYYQKVTSPEGQTLVRNQQGWICFATLNQDSSALIPTATVYRGSNTSVNRSANSISLSEAAILQEVQKNKSLLEPAASKSRAPGWKQPLGPVTGLTIVIDFSDEPGTISTSDVDLFLNSSNYTAGGNNGSVKEWFYDVSEGNLEYTNVVYGYYRALNTFTYYDDETVAFGIRARELITEALNAMNNAGFDFSQLTNVGGNPALNVLYAGAPQKGWSEGLWPHKGSMSLTVGGKTFNTYQICDMGSGLKLGTFIHENGHMLCGYPDLYPYSDAVPDQWVRGFCAMGYGAVYIKENPVPFNPYFRHKSGWYTPEDLTGKTNRTISVSPNEIGVVKYVRNTVVDEQYYIEARADEGRSSYNPSQGLIIWHTYGNGSNTSTAAYPIVQVVQKDNNGTVFQTGDFFVNINGAAFSSSTTPSSNWYSGTASGLDIRNISAYGSTMTYDLGIGGVIDSFTVSVSSSNGTVAKSPDLSKYETGSSVTLTATPSEGYEFTGWSGDTTAAANPLILTMTRNRTVTALFTAVVPDSVTLTLTAENGTISSSPSQTKFLTGETVSLTATPSEGYFFVRWFNALDGHVNPETLTMDADKEAQAEFYPIAATDSNLVKAASWETLAEGTTGTASTLDTAQLADSWRVGAAISVAQDPNYSSYGILQANFSSTLESLEEIRVTYTASKPFSLELYDQGDTVPPIYIKLDASESPITVTIPRSALTTRVNWGEVNTTPLNLANVSSLVFNVENSEADDIATQGIAGEIFINDLRIAGYVENTVPLKNIHAPLMYRAQFSRSTLYLSLPETAYSEISLWSLAGRKTGQLHAGILAAGVHDFRLSGIASGVYIVQIKSDLDILKQRISFTK